VRLHLVALYGEGSTAMELTTILNRCHRLRGFVYEHAHFSTDEKSIVVADATAQRLGHYLLALPFAGARIRPTTPIALAVIGRGGPELSSVQVPDGTRLSSSSITALAANALSFLTCSSVSCRGTWSMMQRVPTAAPSGVIKGMPA
jgi:hypothetical protein